jgi:lysophospholipase L1-like esterase
MTTRTTFPAAAGLRVMAPLLALALSACGGGGSETPEEDGLPMAARIGVGPACEPVRIQQFGDSTQAGYVGATGKIGARNPGTILQRLLDARFGVGRTIVTNHGVGGAVVQDMIDGTGLGGPAATWPVPFTGHIAVVNHGINDATHGTPLYAYQSVLEHLHDMLPVGTTLIYQTPHRVKVHDVLPYAVTMRNVAVARGATMANVFTFTNTLPSWFSYLPDWAHPTEDGYELVTTKVIFPAVAKHVAERTCE